MPISDNLTSGPILSLLTAAGAALASVTGLTSSLGFTPVESDIATAVISTALAVYWIFLAYRVAPPPRGVGFADKGTDSDSIGLFRRLPHISIALVFLLAACWVARPVVLLLSHPTWKLCGTLTGSCASAYCATGFDHRSRPTSQECFLPLDATGYFELTPKSRLAYRPDFLRLQCNGKELPPVRLPTTFSDQGCKARLELP